MKRNYAIDIIKFCFSIVILLYHFDFYFLGGYIMVEGFFMISGFLMMNTLSRQKEDARLAENSTAQFVFRKYSGIFLPLLLSAISGFLIYELIVYPDPKQDIFVKIPTLLFEVFPLQVMGFQAYYSTGVSWYLSALFMGLALIHPFAKRNPKRFAYTVCPPAVLLGYGFLCFQGGVLDLPCEWFFGFINSGLIRAIAGLCAGCILFVLTQKAQNAKSVSVLPRIGFSLLALALWSYIVYGITDKTLVRTYHDYIVAFALFGVLYLELSGKTMLSVIFCHRWVKIFSVISRFVFMNHYAWGQYFLVRYSDVPVEKMLPQYLCCIAISSALVGLLTYLFGLANKGIKKIKRKKVDTEVIAV